MKDIVSKKATRENIQAYYSQTEWHYKWLWHLSETKGLHFGLWDKDTKRLRDAILREDVVLADRAAITPDDVVLDAGCGVGGSSIYLAQTRRPDHWLRDCQREPSVHSSRPW